LVYSAYVIPKKLCSGCGVEKPANIKYFTRSPRYEDNLKPLCIECIKREESEKNRPKMKLYHETKGKARINANPKPYFYKMAKGRAKKHGFAFTITLDDIPDIPTHCPVFGFPLEMNTGEYSPRAPSLDRIDTTKGYEPGNIEFISWRANYLKRNGTLEEFEQLVAHMRKPIKV